MYRRADLVKLFSLPLAASGDWFVGQRAWQSADCVALRELLEPLEVVGGAASLSSCSFHWW